MALKNNKSQVINKESPKKPLSKVDVLSWNMESMIERDLNNKEAAKGLITTVEEQVRKEEKARRVPILRKFYEDYHKAVEENNSIRPDIDPGYTEDLVVRNNGEKIYSKEMGQKKKNAMSKVNNMVNAFENWLKSGDWNTFEKFCKTVK